MDRNWKDNGVVTHAESLLLAGKTPEQDDDSIPSPNGDGRSSRHQVFAMLAVPDEGSFGSCPTAICGSKSSVVIAARL